MQRRHVLTAIGAALSSIAVAPRLLRVGAQNWATPSASSAAMPDAVVNAVLLDPQRRRLGTATLTAGADGQVTIGLTIEPGTLAPGEYKFFLHETGICDSSGAVPFSSAGRADPDGPSEALGTLTIEGEASPTFETSAGTVSLAALRDRDGSALVIHRPGDDAVDEGERVACGVVYPPAEVATAAATPDATPMATPSAAATPGAEATPAVTAPAEVTIEMVDIAFIPAEFTIPASSDVTIRLPNHGVTIHNFHVDPLDLHSGDVPPDEETTVTINAEPGDYEYYCSVPGHREAGMVGMMRVE